MGAARSVGRVAYLLAVVTLQLSAVTDGAVLNVTVTERWTRTERWTWTWRFHNCSAGAAEISKMSRPFEYFESFHSCLLFQFCVEGQLDPGQSDVLLGPDRVNVTLVRQSPDPVRSFLICNSSALSSCLGREAPQGRKKYFAEISRKLKVCSEEIRRNSTTPRPTTPRPTTPRPTHTDPSGEKGSHSSGSWLIILISSLGALLLVVAVTLLIILCFWRQICRSIDEHAKLPNIAGHLERRRRELQNRFSFGRPGDGRNANVYEQSQVAPTAPPAP